MSRESAGTLDLEQTLRMMDVADELRRRRQRVEEHLQQSDRDKIREVLLQRYREMGHAADSALIDAAIETVLAQQYRFRPPAPGLGTKLAKIWVRRGTIARRIGLPLLVLVVVVGIAAAVVGGFKSLRSGRQVRQQQRIEQLAARAEGLLERVREIARDPAAVQLAESYYADVQRGRQVADPAGTAQAIANLEQHAGRLEQEYTLVVVRGRERDRVRHYLIVQAIGPDGRPLRMKIRNEESGEFEEVTEWGERVDKEIYDRVARDYADNQVIDDNVFGQKKRGYLEPETRYPSAGQITRW